MQNEIRMDLIRRNDPNALSLALENRVIYYAIKRMMDFVLALILLALLSPLMLVTALIVFISSPGPIFFKT